MSSPSETTPLKAKNVSTVVKEEINTNADDVKNIVTKAENHVSGAIVTVELDAAEKHNEVKEELDDIKENITDGVEKHSKLIAIGLYVISCFRVCWREHQNKNTDENPNDENDTWKETS